MTFDGKGRPCYVPGPYDNPRQVLRTLDRVVGAGNYDHLGEEPEPDFTDRFL
ncbi:hypothetical protein HNP84_002170 [Thermocatellispora tengchongensis]|uniref:Uncharacterized protein n=1 Tax=Thermocatellispora tengchongensis TaxID=1073253 RepID=A0A840NUM4_9ACTN|nr:hypothetical protein [Thermocatellispora tengchongensis]MBB5132454.1 hypothetical protein [Thermocatellispora tengchongensis]